MRGGGDYTPAHVHALRFMVEKRLELPFLCVTDQAVDADYVPMIHKWPGWWSKMEIFRLRPPILFMDLDTIILGPVSFLQRIESEKFVILRDVYRGKSNPLAMQSSIMYWSEDMTWLYEKFAERPVFDLPHGDQQYLEQTVTASYFQDFTDEIVSFKADVLERNATGKVVIFHGKPRPWQQSRVPYPTERVVGSYKG